MPVFKKALGKIYGIEFSKAEKEAMEKELRSQMIEYDRMHENEIDAMMLWRYTNLLVLDRKD